MADEIVFGVPTSKSYRIAKLACTIYEHDGAYGLQWATAKDEARKIIEETNCECYGRGGYPINNCSECPR